MIAISVPSLRIEIPVYAAAVIAYAKVSLNAKAAAELCCCPFYWFDLLVADEALELFE